MNNKDVAKLFTIQVLGILFVLSFSHFGAAAFDRVFDGNKVFQEGTVIGNTDVSHLTKTEAVAHVTSSFNTWFQNSVLAFHYKEVEQEISSEMFRFSIQESVDRAIDGHISPLVVSIWEPLYKKTIQSFNDELLLNDMDHSKLMNELLNVVSTMKTGNFDFKLLEFVSKDLQTEVIADGAITLTEEQATVLANAFAGNSQVIIPAVKEFSLLNYMTEQSIALSNEYLSLVGSALYETILATNFEVLERHTSRHMPEHSKLGFEAKIMKSNMDLVFFNPNDLDYVVNITVDNGSLSMELIGAPFIYNYEIVLEGNSSYKPKTILQYDPLLPVGTSKIEEQGKDGYLVKVIRKKSRERGDFEEELISEDFYPPVHQVIITSIISKSDGQDEREFDISSILEGEIERELTDDEIDQIINDK